MIVQPAHDLLGKAIRAGALAQYAEEIESYLPTLTGAAREDAAAELLAVRCAQLDLADAA